MGRRDFYQRDTLYDLYVERDALTWYFRILATAGSWLILAGYITFTFAATPSPRELTIDTTTLTVTASVLLVLGHVLVFLTYLFVASLLFRLDVIIVPTLVSSSIGLIAIIVHEAIYTSVSFSQPTVFLPFICAAVGVFTSSTTVIWTHHYIQRVRDLDNRRRSQPVQYSDTPAWAPVSTDLVPLKLLPDTSSDELQRQQLERLLFSRSSNRTPSPEGHSTYKIDIPDSVRDSKYLAPPGDRQPRSYSEERKKFSSSLESFKGLLHGTRRSSSTESKDARERRREEIERGDYRSSILRTPVSAYAGHSEHPFLQPPTPQVAVRKC